MVDEVSKVRLQIEYLGEWFRSVLETAGGGS
jgi:hypothetical protein